MEDRPHRRSLAKRRGVALTTTGTIVRLAITTEDLATEDLATEDLGAGLDPREAARDRIVDAQRRGPLRSTQLDRVHARLRQRRPCATAARSAATLLAFACIAVGTTRARAADCEAPPAAAAPSDAVSSTAPSDVAPVSPEISPTPTDADGSAAAPDPADATPDSAAAALGRTPRRVKCLDESMIDEFGRTAVRKGVQPRDFRKALRVALAIGGGVRAGDLVDTQWQAGANLAFWPFEDLGFDVDFKVSPMTLRVERAATSFTQENRYTDGALANLSYAVLGHVLYAPFHTKLRARGDRIIHGDFVLLGGGGAVMHSSVQAVAFDLGAGFYLFPTKFLSLRFDLVNRIMAQEALGSRRISNDLIFSAGVAFWIPPRRR